MLRTLFISLLCLLGTTRALAWGQKGHDVVAYIAECNLTPEAAEKIDKILGGASMVYWANWLDSASHTPEYAYTATWHYANVDEGFTYETMTKNPDGTSSRPSTGSWRSLKTVSSTRHRSNST